MSEARESGRPVHFGKLMELCVEKNSDIPGQGKYKLRVVYRGDCVEDEWGVNAILKTSPSVQLHWSRRRLLTWCHAFPAVLDSRGMPIRHFPRLYSKAPRHGLRYHVLGGPRVCIIGSGSLYAGCSVPLMDIRSLGGTGSSIVKPTL